MASPLIGPLVREEPGWRGAFTRHEQPGAIPNGTRVVKVHAEAGDANPTGTRGTVLGSLAHPEVLAGEVLYFVEWDTQPRTAVAVAGFKLALPAHGGPRPSEPVSQR